MTADEKVVKEQVGSIRRTAESYGSKENRRTKEDERRAEPVHTLGFGPPQVRRRR
jgi:hypothetical protein